jgi:hypothetical protein
VEAVGRKTTLQRNAETVGLFNPEKKVLDSSFSSNKNILLA